MDTTMTAIYASKDSLKNAVDDLIGKGIPRDKFQVSEENLQIKVVVPEVSEPEIRELLGRHNPVIH